jgi:uncharacterized damage-inducible protein DinB
VSTRITRYRGKFEYDGWANRQALVSLRTMDPAPEKARRWLAHVIGAQDVWLSRLQSDAPCTISWPDLSLAQIEARLEGLRGTWEMLLDQLREPQLDQPISYTNLAGQPYSTLRGEIFDHVLFHGAYHRGQVAAHLREQGGQPIATDHIVWLRLPPDKR